MPEQFNSGRPGKFRGVGVLNRVVRRFVAPEEFLVPGKMPKPYIYNRGFDDSFLLVTDPLTNTSSAIETVSDLGFDALTSTGVAVEAISDLALDALLSAASGSEVLGEIATDVLTSSGGGSQAIGEISPDALTSTVASAQSVADLIAVIDALANLATSLQSLTDQAVDSLTNTGIASEAISDLLRDQIVNLGVSAASMLEAAQEAAQSLTAASQTVSESATESLVTATTAIQALVSEAVVDNLVSLAISGQSEIDALSLFDFFLSIASLQSVLDDLVIGQPPIPAPPAPAPPDAPVTPVVFRPIWNYGRLRARSKSAKGATAKLERQAEAIIEKETLPDYFPVGAHKAYDAFQQFYGSEDGRRIFIKKALEQGHGENVYAKIADVFKTGAKIDQAKKLDTRVQVLGKNGPNVSISPRSSGGVRIIKKGG